ncbi:MAG TPA: hypothetical protein VM492_17085 [Sumerlaeia bacterium]|nr:hypothetical protein [Sumerlaeia bacterium]
MVANPKRCPACGAPVAPRDGGGWECFSCHHVFGAGQADLKPAAPTRAEGAAQPHKGALYVCDGCRKELPPRDRPQTYCVQCRRTLCPACFRHNETLHGHVRHSDVCWDCYSKSTGVGVAKAHEVRARLRQRVKTWVGILLALAAIFLVVTYLLPSLSEHF